MQLQQTQQLLHGMMLKHFGQSPSHAEQDVLLRKLEERLDEVSGQLEKTKTCLEETSTRFDEQVDHLANGAVTHVILHPPSPWELRVRKPQAPPKKPMPLSSLGPFPPFSQAGRVDADAGCKRMQLAQKEAAKQHLCAEKRQLRNAERPPRPQQGGPDRFSPKRLPVDTRDGHVQAWVVPWNS